MTLRKTALSLAAAAFVLLGTVLATALPASASYGAGAAYQVEITSNLTGKDGGGVWLWIQLTPDPSSNGTWGTGDYTGSDCGHGHGAVSDKGDVTWSASGGMLTINGVVLNGLGGLPVTVTVPSTYGHESTDVVSVFPELGTVLGLPPGVGFSQVQVAP